MDTEDLGIVSLVPSTEVRKVSVGALRDGLQDRIDELESENERLLAQIPVVGTFAWALMQNWDNVEANLFGSYVTLNEYGLYSTDMPTMATYTKWRLCDEKR